MQWNLVTNSIGDFYDSKVRSNAQIKVFKYHFSSETKYSSKLVSYFFKKFGNLK